MLSAKAQCCFLVVLVISSIVQNKGIEQRNSFQENATIKMTMFDKNVSTLGGCCHKQPYSFKLSHKRSLLKANMKVATTKELQV